MLAFLLASVASGRGFESHPWETKVAQLVELYISEQFSCYFYHNYTVGLCWLSFFAMGARGRGFESHP